jgi:hypothetical protein
LNRITDGVRAYASPMICEEAIVML